MAESTRPVSGNTCHMASPELKEQIVAVGNSGATLATASTVPIFYDANHDAYITSIQLCYSTANTGSSATAEIGIASDTDALVSAFNANASADPGDVDALTLRTTFNQTVGEAQGFYKVPAGTALLATQSSGFGNGNGYYLVHYVLLDKYQ